MPVIYCSLDMFAYNQAIRIVEDDGSNTVIYATSDTVAEAIASLCKEKNITNVHLYGNETYLNPVVSNIQTNYNLHYHCGNPLNIEVN